MSWILFAQTSDTDELVAAWRITPAVFEAILIFGAIGLVTLLLLLWAVFLRKRRRRRRKQHDAHRNSARPAEVPGVTEDESAPAMPEKRRRRRLGRRHRSRNPTLAETGGLPPVRREGSSEPEP